MAARKNEDNIEGYQLDLRHVHPDGVVVSETYVQAFKHSFVRMYIRFS